MGRKPVYMQTAQQYTAQNMITEWVSVDQWTEITPLIGADYDRRHREKSYELSPF